MATITSDIDTALLPAGYTVAYDGIGGYPTIYAPADEYGMRVGTPLMGCTEDGMDYRLDANGDRVPTDAHIIDHAWNDAEDDGL